MTSLAQLLDSEILPRIFDRLDSVFPEFAWKRTRTGWIATNSKFTHSQFDCRADRIVCRANNGFYIAGERSVHWLEYANNGSFPRGEQWANIVKLLADRVNFLLPSQTVFTKQTPRMRALLELEKSFQFGGDFVEDYLASRGSLADPNEFGVLPDEPVAILESAGFSKSEIFESEVFSKSKWQGRVCALWRNEHGQVKSIWGRATGLEEPKYLFLPGSKPLFYGADVAFKSAQANKSHGIIVVEGHFDVHALRAAGYPETVSPAQAGFDTECVRLLEPFQNATLLLDSDRAGRKGTVRSIEKWAYSYSPLNLFVATIEGAKDPDELLQKNGVEALKKCLENSQPAAAALIDILFENAANDVERFDAARRAIPIVTAIGVCHPLQASKAVEKLEQRGFHAQSLKLLTDQLSLEQLVQMRTSLQRKLEHINELIERN